MCAYVCACIHVCIFHVDGYHKLPAGYDFHATCLISSSARGREVLSPDTTEAPSQASYHEQYVKKNGGNGWWLWNLWWKFAWWNWWSKVTKPMVYGIIGPNRWYVWNFQTHKVPYHWQQFPMFNQGVTNTDLGKPTAWGIWCVEKQHQQRKLVDRNAFICHCFWPEMGIHIYKPAKLKIDYINNSGWVLL